MLSKLAVVLTWALVSSAYIYAISRMPVDNHPSWSGYGQSFVLLFLGGMYFHVLMRLLAAPSNPRGWRRMFAHIVASALWCIVIVVAVFATGEGSLGHVVGVPSLLGGIVMAVRHAIGTEHEFRVLCNELALA